MIKLIVGAIVLGAAGVAWLRMQWAVDKNKRAAGKIIEGLKSGTLSVESFEESLGMNIKSRQLPAEVSVAAFQEKLIALTNIKLCEKFKIQYVAFDQNNNGIVIAEGKVKDTLSAASNSQVDVTYPCWIYIELPASQQEVYFKSSMPDGKDHHYLLEDISDAIFAYCVKYEK